MKDHEIITKFKEYRVNSQETYESISREIGVAYTTVFHWLNKTKKVSPLHLKAIKEFLIKRGVILLALTYIVSWDLKFTRGGGIITNETRYESFTDKENMHNFIKEAPDKEFECEHNGFKGICEVSNFEIDIKE